MPLLVSQGAILKCSYGNAPTPLIVLPSHKVKVMMPVAVKSDHIPIVNILPFGMCSNPLNPMVLAATLAHLGVLTPVPCIPCTIKNWESPCKKVKADGKEVITSSSKLKCLYGGKIQVTFPGQVKVIV